MNNISISTEALLPWDTYFRKYVNRREASLVAPRIFPIEEFSLSKGSVLHYLPADFSDKGPVLDNPIFKGVTRNIFSYYVESLETLEGNPRLLTVAISNEIRKYHAENKKIRRAFDLHNGLRDVESPLVINYCYLDRKYKYITNPKKDWYYNNNYINTIVKNMYDVFKTNENANQFLMVEMPRTIPTLPIFTAINRQESNNSILKFNTFTKVLLLHIFNLINNGEDSNRHAFNDISKRALNKINIVFVESGYASILNLGTLVSWVKSVDNTSGKNPKIIRLYFIRFLLSLMKVRSDDIEELISRAEDVDNSDVSSTELVEDEIDYSNPLTKISDTDSISDIETDDDEDNSKNTVYIDEKEKIQPVKEIDKSIKLDTNTDTLYYDSNVLSEDEERELKLLNDQLDIQLNTLEEVISKREIKEVQASNYQITEDEPLPLEEEILYQLDELIDLGLISPMDYEKYQRLAISYKEIKIDDKTLEEYIDIKQEDIQLQAKKIPDSPVIQNKDMLESTLFDMSKRYTKDVLQRDIASMVVSMQRGGICVTDYKVTETEDSTGRYNNYEVKIAPLKGKASTVKFKLPVITEDGTFINNASEYRLRMAITDMPIRKISSTRVSLKSSYGKVFVDLSERKAFNYRKWLCNNIRAASLDKSNSRITESRTGNVFDKDIKVPLLYSILSNEFRTFTANNIFFYFDYHKRHRRFDSDIVSLIESNNQYVVCGKVDDDIVVMDFDNVLYRYNINSKDYTPLPPLEEICGLDQSKSPISVAEMVVLGRSIPIGIILGYKLGFSNLLRLLGVEYKVISDYRGFKIESDEYSVGFRDQLYVFKKKDTIAAMILNGFNVYKDAISDFDTTFFDRRDVYFNILETKEAASRTLKEIDLLFSMFVDPITLKLLKELYYPVTFRGLILKSCELLSESHFEDEVSGYGQRIRGYEKMASLVYSELVSAIRLHNGKSNSQSNQITINPNDILLKFLNDPGCVKVNGLNPFQNIRQMESATYTGNEGRSKDTMVKRTRKYHEGSIGVVSEATVDSGDVGINIYTSANPQFTSLYGTTKPTTEETRNGKVNTVQMMSTVFNTLPAIEKDD